MPSDTDSLPDDPAILQQMLQELLAENDKLRLLLQRFSRHQFGRRSEQLTADQLQFGLEDQEQTLAEHQAAGDAAEAAAGRQSKPRVGRPVRNHGALPSQPIDGGMPTEALIVHVMVSKFCDSLPLYRQSQMLARQGIALDRSTLSHWAKLAQGSAGVAGGMPAEGGSACWWLTPLYELVVATVLSSPKIFADDTSLPVLDPGRGRTRAGCARKDALILL